MSDTDARPHTHHKRGCPRLATQGAPCGCSVADPSARAFPAMPPRTRGLLKRAPDLDNGHRRLTWLAWTIDGVDVDRAEANRLAAGRPTRENKRSKGGFYDGPRDRKAARSHSPSAAEVESPEVARRAAEAAARASMDAGRTPTPYRDT